MIGKNPLLLTEKERKRHVEKDGFSHAFFCTLGNSDFPAASDESCKNILDFLWNMCGKGSSENGQISTQGAHLTAIGGFDMMTLIM